MTEQRLPQGVYRSGEVFQARFQYRGQTYSQSGFDTPTKAERWRKAEMARARRPDSVEPQKGRATFGDFRDQWLPTRLRKGAGTLKAMGTSFQRIDPVFASVRFDDLTKDMVDTFVADLADRDYAESTIRITMQHFFEVTNAAVKQGYLRPEVLADVELPRPDDEAVDPTTVLDVAQVQALTEAMPARWRIAIAVAAMTGVRVGECLGLTVDKVDWMRGGPLYVHRQLLVKDGEGLYLAPTKNKRKRSVPIHPRLMELLVAHLAAFPATEVEIPVMEKGRQLHARRVSFLMAGPDGRPYRPGNFTAQMVAKAVAEARLPAGTGFHSLRHHFASLLLANGKSLPYVQKVLGHSHLSTTANIYCHCLPDDDDHTSALDAAYQGFQNSSKTGVAEQKTVAVAGPLVPERS
jgi:integrase